MTEKKNDRHPECCQIEVKGFPITLSFAKEGNGQIISNVKNILVSAQKDFSNIVC